MMHAPARDLRRQSGEATFVRVPPVLTAFAALLGRRPYLGAAGLFLVALVPLLATPVLPLIDHYNHVARFYVLSHLTSDPLLAANFKAHWALLPDIGLDVVATPLLAVLPPLPAAHLLAVLVMAVLFSGVLYFNRALTGRPQPLVALLMVPLLYSYVFNWGFSNYILAEGAAFWAAGWWVANRAHPIKATPVAIIFAFLIFLCHAMAFALYGIMLGLLEIGFFLRARPRQARDLLMRLSLLLLQAVVPVLLFVAWEQSRSGEAAIVHHSGFGAASYLHNLTPRPGHIGLRRLQTILRVEEGPAYWFDILTFLLQLAAIGFLFWRRRAALTRTAWLLVAAGLLMIVFVPTMMFGVNYIADRMPLFAALLLLGALQVSQEVWSGRERLACTLLAAVMLARIGATAVQWRGYGEDYRQFQSVAAHLPPGAFTLNLALGAGRHETEIPRCEMYGGLLIAQYRQIGPLFAFKGQHPVLLAGQLQQNVARLEQDAAAAEERIGDGRAYMMAARSAGFDYLLLCNAQLLAGPPPAGFSVLARTQRFLLMRMKAGVTN
ncbi:MAG TPA: hypothetical protein VN723_08050 [Rhizomicrobium sp.]|jgi:hypothetical protein|nr:hypothetical protein [Rhizomicrobium sp.]